MPADIQSILNRGQARYADSEGRSGGMIADSARVLGSDM
jgi:hypothetical protein